MSSRVKKNEAPAKQPESAGCCCGNKQTSSPSEISAQELGVTKDAAVKHNQGCKSTG
ncbi:hypothetical protein [Rhizorhapis sp. SPR117]|uniref:hypothetical protein n=1 Tax=Rhizorhapis sp. SPR117 TaxID=2912611 RepID=UPI001F28172A|nr:hypothetical protein [Rhizorhapis sp. SPR117]